MNVRLSISALAMTVALPGCALHRAQPETPPVELPGYYRSLEVTSPTEALTSDKWWAVLGDAGLDALIDRALAGNPDLAMAMARIEASRARSRHVRAVVKPNLTLGTSSHREQLSGNGLFGAATRSGAFPDLYSQHQAGIDASWEFDLFGAQAAKRRSARADEDLAASELAARRLSLPSEVTRLYVEHLTLAQTISSAERSLQAGEQRLVLLSQRHEQGDLPEQTLIAARMDVEQLRASLPALTASREAIRHAMGALLGTGEYVALPEESPLLKVAPASLDAGVAAGLPSELLRRRPDILGAEAGFQRAFAEHRFAIADQYPRFALLGSFGHDSLRSGDLLQAASQAWTLTSQLTLPLLDGGRRRSVVQVRQAELDEAIAQYRKSVVAALVDVEQSLLARQAAQQALTVQSRRLADAGRYLAAERARYELGDCAMTQLLDARLLFEEAVATELDARRDALLGFVRVQKSLGGPS